MINNLIIIESLVCEYFEVSKESMYSKDVVGKGLIARQYFFYLSVLFLNKKINNKKSLAFISLKKIGRFPLTRNGGIWKHNSVGNTYRTICFRKKIYSDVLKHCNKLEELSAQQIVV